MESLNNVIKVRIQDNREGIDPNNIEKIFDEFVSIPTKYFLKGTGLRLYISKEIVKRHGGRIIAELPNTH